MGGFPLCHRLSGFYEDLNMIAIIGTSDRPCWLAEACKILLFFFSSSIIGTSDRPCWLAEACKILLLQLLTSASKDCHSEEHRQSVWTTEDSACCFGHSCLSGGPLQKHSSSLLQ